MYKKTLMILFALLLTSAVYSAPEKITGWKEKDYSMERNIL